MYLSIEAVNAEIAYRREGMRGFGRKRAYTSPTVKSPTVRSPKRTTRAPRPAVAETQQTTNHETAPVTHPVSMPKQAHGTARRRPKRSDDSVKV